MAAAATAANPAAIRWQGIVLRKLNHSGLWAAQLSSIVGIIPVGTQRNATLLCSTVQQRLHRNLLISNYQTRKASSKEQSFSCIKKRKSRNQRSEIRDQKLEISNQNANYS
jgi:hypothetical protein